MPVESVRDLSSAHNLTAILPCNDLNASETFYAKLGFTRVNSDSSYRILSDGKGGAVHLTAAVEGWLVPGRNPFGLYLYTEDVDALFGALRGIALHPPKEQPWGMYEFAVSDPDETLVRIGWPSSLSGHEPARVVQT